MKEFAVMKVSDLVTPHLCLECNRQDVSYMFLRVSHKIKLHKTFQQLISVMRSDTMTFGPISFFVKAGRVNGKSYMVVFAVRLHLN